MLQQIIRQSLLSPSRRPPAACLRCPWRAFTTTCSRLASPTPQASKPLPNPAPPAKDAPRPAAPEAPEVAPQLDPLASAPRYYGTRVDDFTPTTLFRPIGMNRPPKPGENTGLDERTLQQKRDDMVDWDKHLQRRQELKAQFYRPYFRDWTNIKLHKGKTFLAPPRLFRHDKSLYFPNLFGQTMVKTTSRPTNTTPLLHEKASVVALFCSTWAERQTQSFMSEESNPALHKLLKERKQDAQLVRVNVEDQTRMKYWLLRAMTPWIRRRLPEEDWNKYFTVKAGISDEIRESIGLLNGKVGYVYLVDGDCRIRWAGSGPAEAAEAQALTKGMATLLREKDEGIW